MQQQISVITLGIADIARSKRFYGEGFGWKPVFETPEIVFYQMNGLMLGTWLGSALEADMQRGLGSARRFLARSQCLWRSATSSRCSIDSLAHGGRLLRAADAPPHGGFRGYVADPDDHAWEIALQSGLADLVGRRVTFGLVKPQIEPAGRVGARPVLTAPCSPQLEGGT